jgi:HEAT repeat protein
MARSPATTPTRLERALRVHGGERALVGWLVALFTVVQSSHGLGANAADALFFQRFGVEQLPLMILISGAAVMISVLAHGGGLASRGVHRWLPLVTVACGLWAAVMWAGALVDHRSVYPVIWISTQAIMMVSLTVMWNAAGASCTTRQAKRLFPIFATAGVAGGVIGNVLTGPLASLLGTQNLLLIQAGLLFAGSGLLLRVRRLFGSEDDHHPDSVLAGLTSTWASVRSSRFLTLSAGVAVALFCLFYLVYFPFSESVANSFATEAGTAAFLGVFSSIATAATFLFSLFVTNRLFARFGLVVTLMIAPVVYTTGFAAWLFVFNLQSAAIVRGLQWVTVNAIALTAYNALFNVMPRRHRGQVLAFMTALPAQVGVSLAGLLLLVTAAIRIETVFITGLVISVLTLGMAMVLRREYLEAVVSAVRRGVVGLFDTPARAVFTPADADSIRALKDRLNDPRPGARALAVAGLGRLGQSDDAVALEPLLGDADPRVRSAAFDSVCAIEPDRVSGHAARAIKDEVPEVRLQVARYLAAQPDQEGASVARVALADLDPRVRAAAAVAVGDDEGERVVFELLESNDPRSVAAALRETSRPTSTMDIDPTPYLESPSSLVRATAASVYPGRGGDPEILRPRLDDRSHRVRTEAAAALASTADGRAILLDVLESGSVGASEAALRALAPRDELSAEFTDWARREAERAALLMSYAGAVERAEPSLAKSSLLSVLEKRSQRLVQWVLLAMTTAETRGAMPLVARGVQSDDPETRSQAIEALETIGAKTVLTVLLPLLEPEGETGSGDLEETLKQMTRDFDPWINALAGLLLEEAHETPGEGSPILPSLTGVDPSDAPAILDNMERVLVLQRVDMFSDLDPEDLVLIAQAAEERYYEPHAPIFHQGDPGDEMLVIVEGSAVVSVSEKHGARLVDTYGAGDHVGELSLLTGGPRSADVVAGDEGARGLALSASDLITVLEERTNVAVALLRTLAQRLVDQT